MTSQRSRERTYARNRVFSRRGNEKITESDSIYYLKLVLCLILGTLWLKFQQPLQFGGLQLYGIPIGLPFGILLVRKFEKYQYNRKLWYLVLTLVTVVCFWLPMGIVI